MEITPIVYYANTSHFTNNLGTFYGMWLALEATIDYQIGRLLKQPYTETHILTAGMEFGRKANLLRILISRSDHPNKEHIKRLLTKLQQESKRNIFTHSILHSLADEVTFIHRKIDGAFSATGTRFTKGEFESHVKNMVNLANDFGRALDFDHDDFQSFCAEAHNAMKSDSTSPQPPSSKE
jgi:hypothetical protein